MFLKLLRPLVLLVCIIALFLVLALGGDWLNSLPFYVMIPIGVAVAFLLGIPLCWAIEPWERE